jgi:hypothetical protein
MVESSPFPREIILDFDYDAVGDRTTLGAEAAGGLIWTKVPAISGYPSSPVCYPEDRPHEVGWLLDSSQNRRIDPVLPTSWYFPDQWDRQVALATVFLRRTRALLGTERP